MGNQGSLTLLLKNSQKEALTDPAVDFVFRRGKDNAVVGTAEDISFSSKAVFQLPAFPQAQNLYCDITPTRYRHRKSNFFTLVAEQNTTRELEFLRLPSQWKARFKKWKSLPPSFSPFKATLQRSPELRVRAGVTLGNFTGDAYDDVDDEKTTLAKASLTNLFIKLQHLVEPFDERPWFSFVSSILEIGRERMIAIIDPKMASLVRKIKDNISDFNDYKHAPAENHWKNFPTSYQVLKSKLYSVKSTEDEGNAQLTIGVGSDPETGAEVFLLDADIDENGKLFLHFADLFKHKVTGGTHPFDIYELLVAMHPRADLGYELV